MNEKIYSSAPLPFQGQKRHFVSQVARLLEEHNRKQRIEVVVDLFGGSGLLAYVAKRTLPDARVIFNDYDGYHTRLLSVQKTNRLLADLRAIIGDHPRHKMLRPTVRAAVLGRIEAEVGYVDYITISSSLLFSGKYALDFAELTKAGIYNNVRTTDYEVRPDDYLDGLEIHKADHRAVYERFKDASGVVFLIDPPYLSTDTKTYASDKYWKLKDYLNVLKVLRDSRYVYFTSNKSSLAELVEWLGENPGIGNPLRVRNFGREPTTSIR